MRQYARVHAEAVARAAALLGASPAVAATELVLRLLDVPPNGVVCVLNELLTDAYGFDLVAVRARQRSPDLHQTRLAWVYCLLRLDFGWQMVAEALVRDHASIAYTARRLATHAVETESGPQLEYAVLAERCEPLLRAVREATGWTGTDDPYGSAEVAVPTPPPSPADALADAAPALGLAPQTTHAVLVYLDALVQRRLGIPPAEGLVGLRALAASPALRRVAADAYAAAGSWPPYLEHWLPLQARAAGVRFIA